MHAISHRLPIWLACLIVVLSFADVSHGLSVGGVDVSDFVVLDIVPGEDLELSTSGDIYLFAPFGLSASALDVDAVRSIVVNLDLDISGIASFCSLPQCVDRPPTIFQDVVLRVSGVVGALALDSGGSVVIDEVPIPEPSTLALVALGLLALLRARRSATGVSVSNQATRRFVSGSGAAPAGSGMRRCQSVTCW